MYTTNLHHNVIPEYLTAQAAGMFAGQSTKNACAVPDLGVHDDKIYLFEPMAARNQLDFSAQWQTHPWTSYPNIVCIQATPATI